MDLHDGRIGIIDLTVDQGTYLMIETDKYYYDVLDTAQFEYVTPELKEQDSTCYINMNWAQIGRELVTPTNTAGDDTQSMIGWKTMIIMCMTLLFALLIERIYFYVVIYKKLKQDIEMEKDDDISIDGQDPVQLFENKRRGLRTKGGYQQTRSYSVSAAGSYLNHNKGYSPSFSRSGSGSRNNNKHFVAALPPHLGLPNGNGHNKSPQSRGRKQGRAMSMQISSYPFTRPPTKEEFLVQRKRQNSASKSRTPPSIDEIAPLPMNGNNSKIKKRNKRHMSVPHNLMSDNALKKRDKASSNGSMWINEHEDDEFWKKELRVLKEAGFENNNENLGMLIKYAVRNENEIIDKRMTQSIVLRILQKKKANKKQAKHNEEADDFLENEWEDDNNQNAKKQKQETDNRL